MNKSKITIGTDPEFIVARKGEVIDADQLPFADAYASAFGCDGTPFELRPGFSTDTIYLTHRIRMILKRGIELIPGLRKCRFIAGHFAEGESLGGHIHISSDLLTPCDVESLVELLDKVLIDGLDKFLSTRKHNEMRERRRSWSYGQRGDYRMEYRGDRFEYRAPCSFLSSPKITFLNLSLAKVCTMALIHEVDVERILSAVRPKHILQEVITMIKSSKKLSCKDIKLAKKLLEEALRDKASMKVRWYDDFKRRWDV